MFFQSMKSSVATPEEIAAKKAEVAAALRASEIAVQFADAIGHALAEHAAAYDPSAAIGEMELSVLCNFLGLHDIADEPELYMGTAELLRVHDAFMRGVLRGATRVKAELLPYMVEYATAMVERHKPHTSCRAHAA